MEKSSHVYVESISKKYTKIKKSTFKDIQISAFDESNNL